MRHIITICQEIRARDTWDESQLKNQPLNYLAERLIKKYDNALYSQYGYTSTINDTNFYCIDTSGKIRTINLEKPISILFDHELKVLFWTMDKTILSYNKTTDSHESSYQLSLQAYRCIDQNNIDEACGIADKIDDRAIKSDVLTRIAYNLEQKKEYTKAMDKAMRIPDPEKKLMAFGNTFVEHLQDDGDITDQMKDQMSILLKEHEKRRKGR